MNTRLEQKSQRRGPAHDELAQAKLRCPLPILMRHLGLANYIKKSCRSPFRSDQSASWGVYKNNGVHRWKDFGTGEGGDQISLLAQYLHIDQYDNFVTLV